MPKKFQAHYLLQSQQNHLFNCFKITVPKPLAFDTWEREREISSLNPRWVIPALILDDPETMGLDTHIQSLTSGVFAASQSTVSAITARYLTPCPSSNPLY